MENIEKKEVRVRFHPVDTDETFDGTVFKEEPNYYVVIPDENLTLKQCWNKKRCEIISNQSKPDQENDDKGEGCPDCDGKGEISTGIFGIFHCVRCNGSGKILKR